MEMILMAAGTVAAILIVMAKLDIRKFLGFDAPLDIIVTFGLGALGAATGTFSGVILGIFAGLMFSLVFWLLKKLIGYQKLTLQGWVTVAPAWRVSDEQVKAAKAKAAKSRRERVQRAWQSQGATTWLRENL